MHFFVITLFPEMFSAIEASGITRRAFEQGLSSLTLINPRDFAQGNYRRVDEKLAGGGAGMVMMAEPLIKAIEQAKSQATDMGCKSTEVIYLSPQGQTLDESNVCHLGDRKSLILLCGRYEGVDQRVIDALVDHEISIGDYVLSGGELPAMVLMDSLIRRLPGALGDERSAQTDSFVDGLLGYAVYTKPDEILGVSIPAVLKSGDHKKIEKWRFLEQYTRTKNRRADMLASFKPSKEQLKWISEAKLDT